MADRRRSVLLLLVCWSLMQSGRAERYTAGTLRQYLQEVVTEALAAHCPQPPAGRCPGYTTAPPPAYGTRDCDCDRAANCAAGYLRCGDVCYRRLSGQVSHADAQKACRRHGGRLAVPRSADQDLCSRALALGAEVWLGITDQHGSGTYRGSGGEAVAADGPYWDNGQPDRYQGEDPSGERCVELFPAAGWHDRTCGHRARPLCQQD